MSDTTFYREPVLARLQELLHQAADKAGPDSILADLKTAVFKAVNARLGRNPAAHPEALDAAARLARLIDPLADVVGDLLTEAAAVFGPVRHDPYARVLVLHARQGDVTSPLLSLAPPVDLSAGRLAKLFGVIIAAASVRGGRVSDAVRLLCESTGAVPACNSPEFVTRPSLPDGCLPETIDARVRSWWNIIPAGRYHSMLIDHASVPSDSPADAPRMVTDDGTDITESLLRMAPAELSEHLSAGSMPLLSWATLNNLAEVTADRLFAARRAHGVTAPLTLDPYPIPDGSWESAPELLASLTFDSRSPAARWAEIVEKADAAVYLARFKIRPASDDPVECRRNLLAALSMVAELPEKQAAPA